MGNAQKKKKGKVPENPVKSWDSWELVRERRVCRGGEKYHPEVNEKSLVICIKKWYDDSWVFMSFFKEKMRRLL